MITLIGFIAIAIISGCTLVIPLAFGITWGIARIISHFSGIGANAKSPNHTAQSGAGPLDTSPTRAEASLSSNYAHNATEIIRIHELFSGHTNGYIDCFLHIENATLKLLAFKGQVTRLHDHTGKLVPSGNTIIVTEKPPHKFQVSLLPDELDGEWDLSISVNNKSISFPMDKFHLIAHDTGQAKAVRQHFAT